MKTRLALLALLALLTACSGRTPTPPWLQSTEKPRDENYHGGSVTLLLLRYDANHDGTLTKEELAAGLKAEFAAHDVHHNGCLDPDQVAAINQARVEADQSAATPIVDWNQDGCVDYTEFSAAPYSLFDQLDANHDGKLTPKELGPAAAKRAMSCVEQQGGEGRRGRGGRGGRGGGGMAPASSQCPASDGDTPGDTGEPPAVPPPGQ
jgi:hypothetical protein